MAAPDNNFLVPMTSVRYLIDSTQQLNKEEVLKASFQSNFKPFATDFQQIDRSSANYWLMIPIPHQQFQEEGYMLEFIDCHIDEIEGWLIIEGDTLTYPLAGHKHPFNQRKVKHKNFIYDIPYTFTEQSEPFFLFRIQSANRPVLICKYRSLDYNFYYANLEYAALSFFYGALAILLLFNLLSFLLNKEKKYLSLAYYLAMCMLVATIEDGLGFQYLWPAVPAMNTFLEQWGLAIYLFFLLSYLVQLLGLHDVFQPWKRGLFGAYLVLTVLISANIPHIQPVTGWLYILPVAVISAFCCWKAKTKDVVVILMALGCCISLFGILPKVNLLRDEAVIVVYYFNFAVFLQGMIFTFAMVYEHRRVKHEKERSQLEFIEGLKAQNEIIEHNVQVRTAEIQQQHFIISHKNEELLQAYREISHKTEALEALNKHLSLNNNSLKKNIKLLTNAHLQQQVISFTDFKTYFPTTSDCIQFLADKKWTGGYQCKKCGHTQFHQGQKLLSHRCSKCGYDEAPTADTIFHRLHFSVLKGFYLVFHLHHISGKPNISQLAKSLDLSVNTCWRFTNKVMERKQQIEANDSWEKIIFDRQDNLAEWVLSAN